MNIDSYADLMSEKINEAIRKAFNAGFQYAMSINLNDSEFVDLGLQSGTKWAKTYLGITELTSEGIFCSCDESKKLSIPTEDQIKELQDDCKFVYNSNNSSTRIIGPNGNEIEIFKNYTWCIADKTKRSFGYPGSKHAFNNYVGACSFWVRSDQDNKPKVASIYVNDGKPYIRILEAEPQLFKYGVLLVKRENNI